MKKTRIIAVIAALIVSLSGCANTDHPQTIQDSSGIETVASETYEHTEPEDDSSASVSESKERSDDSTAAVKAETESAQAENLQSAAEQSPAPGTQPPQIAVPNNTPKPETPKSVEPTPEPKPTPPPAEETPKVEQPQETTPAPEEPAVPEFNIQTWIDYAKTYAVSVGLRLESSAVDCWDNPITAGAYSTCLAYIQRLKIAVSFRNLLTGYASSSKINTQSNCASLLYAVYMRLSTENSNLIS